MKTEIFRNALELSVEELEEIRKIKGCLAEITRKEVRIKEIRSGFRFFEIETYDYPKNHTFRIEEDKSTYINTSAGFVKINNEIGEVIYEAIKEKQEKEEFICVKLLPL